MGKGKKAAKAAAAIIEDPLADAASEEQLLEPQVSEPESSAGPRAGSALDVEELSEGAENSDDDDDEMTEETLKKMFELLGPEELAFLQQETDDAEGNGEEEDDEGESESEQGASGSEEEANSDSEEANVPPPPRSDAAALDRVLKTFKLDTSFFDTQSLTYPDSLDIPDASDDLAREVQFYKQSLWAANEGRKRFEAANKPFARPNDFYAEMVKTDAHMERIRQRLLDERASLEASEKAKAQRQLKKFGKQVQVAKQQEREKAKKALDEKVKDFKNKKKRNASGGGEEDFGVELDDDDERPAKKPRGIVIKQRGGKGKDGQSKMPREARNAKYGHPSAGRRGKQNTKESSGDISGFNKSRNKQKAAGNRPGKARRASGR